MATPKSRNLAPKGDYDTDLGARSPRSSLGVPATDRHIDTGQTHTTRSRPSVPDLGVARGTTGGPNSSGFRNTAGLHPSETDPIDADG